jgi:exonuclease III
MILPQFWENMMQLGSTFNGPWLCIGDFNMILSQQDKMGGLLYASSSTDYFHEFVNSFGLVDLGFTGNPFTWSNHRDGRHLIRQRLDCGMASSQWVHLFPSTSILHLPALSSDHSPLLLDTVHSDFSLA